MIEVIRAISDAAVAMLAETGWPSLRPLLNGSPGQILVLDTHRLDQFMPPRVVFMPTKSTFGPRATSRGAVPVAANLSGYDEQSKIAIANPAIWTEKMGYEVRCWSIASDNEDDPSGADFECTQALYQIVIAAMESVMTGCYGLSGGAWNTVAHSTRVGREFVFSVDVMVPVLRNATPPPAILTSLGIAPGMPFAPSDVVPDIIDTIITPDGNSGPGCE